MDDESEAPSACGPVVAYDAVVIEFWVFAGGGQFCFLECCDVDVVFGHVVFDFCDFVFDAVAV